LALAQHLPRGKIRREDPEEEGLFDGIFRGMAFGLIFFFASAYINKLTFGSNEYFFFSFFVSALITNILVPIFMSYWHGTNLLYPGWRQLWIQRVGAVTLLAILCFLLSAITLLVF
jgi:hypothetical protein